MITKYECVCIEHSVKKRDGPRLNEMLSLESKEFRSLTKFFAPETSIYNHSKIAQKEQIDSWLKGKERGKQVFDIFVAEKTARELFVVELASIKPLQSVFGKKHQKAAGYLSIYAYGASDDFAHTRDRFYEFYRKKIKKAFKLPVLPKVSRIYSINQTFSKMEKKHADQSISSGVDTKCIEFLRDPMSRSIMYRTKQAGGASIGKIAQSTGQEIKKVEPYVLEAKEIGLLVLEYDIKCISCEKVIARLPSKDSIRKLTEERIHCPNCNRPVTEGDSEDVYLVPKGIAKILDGGKWMTLDVKNELTKLGFLEKNVLTEIKDGPNELDVIGNIEGQLILVECKDSQFSIGHAYPFVGKCTKYAPDVSIIIATGGIGPEVKDYLKGTRTETRFIEDLKNLSVRLEEVFGSIHARNLALQVNSVPYHHIFRESLSKMLGFDTEETAPRRDITPHYSIGMPPWSDEY